jgi:hypothetical protein
VEVASCVANSVCGGRDFFSRGEVPWGAGTSIARARTSVSARWAGNRKPPSQRAAQQPGSETPMCTPPKTSFERSQRQGGGGGGPPCPPGGQATENPRLNGQPNNLDRKPQCAPLQRHRSKGARDRVAGGADLRVRSAGHPTGNTRSNGQPNNLDRKSRFPVLKTGDASERIDCSTFYCSTLSASRRADLRVCSAGHPTKNTRPNGQPNRLDRQSRFPVLETGDASERIDCSTFDCSTLSASGRAELRVRSAGYPTDNPRPNGQPNRLDRQSQCGPICRHGGIDPSSTPAGAIP